VLALLYHLTEAILDLNKLGAVSNGTTLALAFPSVIKDSFRVTLHDRRRLWALLVFSFLLIELPIICVTLNTKIFRKASTSTVSDLIC